MQEQSNVEAALYEKMEKSAQLKTALQSSVETAEQHMESLLADKAEIESLIGMKQQAYELSVNRYQLRTQRPDREHTSDETQNLLCKQQAHLQKNIKALASFANEAENLYKKLASLRATMKSDLKDKATALQLDAKALSLDGRDGMSVTHSVGGAVAPYRERAWGRKSAVVIQDTKSVCEDAVRLHRRLLKVEKDLEASEAAIMKEVQKSLKMKLGQTLQAASVLDKKLRHGYKEIDNAARAKDRLVQALDGKVAPMDLVQQRYHTRHSTRPGREAVHDEVEIALATEFSELNSMVRELSKKHKKVNVQINHLNGAAQNLEHNLRDKRQAYDVDAQCYRLAAGWRPGQSHPVYPRTLKR